MHYVFDLWTHQWRNRSAEGDVIVVRYADDSVMGFETKSEAQRFLEALHERMAKFGLRLNEEKTRILELDGMRPNAAHAGGNAARKRSTSSGPRTSAR